ncbi:DNA repair protein RecN [Leptodesmis sp.]|uniref:DNA repair protein RecN n=1 Tax=Leptodesmis sp. TaxID=3100501 RepID=UPI0040535763
MLLSLRIENFALVDYLDLDLGAGLTVLTGETGAGKSIILDALDAALGGKVTGRVVRTGEERAAIEASFKLTADLRAWLSQQEIEPLDEDVLLCSREVIANSGSQRSRSRVNGVVVNKQQMEQLRDRLVEITAQGQTVQLGQPALQREWLDGYGGERLLRQREQVAAAFAAYQQAVQLLDKRRRAEQERLQQLDLFEYQLRELNAASLTDPDELELLEQEAKRLGHSVELQQQSYQVYQALYQSDHEAKACADLLGEAENTLTHMLEYDPQLQPILELVSAALAQVEEAGREINAYGDSIEADPERLQEVQERIADLKQVCRKYGPTLKDAIELRDRLQNELLELTGGGQSLEELEAAVHSSQVALTEACAHLTQLRRTAAVDLETRLVNELKPLAMEKVKFQVSITPIAPSASGADQITFLFSPNPGEPLQPLTEIASGGEMSRFLLALQASFSQIDPVGTLVFDEIDVGVSGRVSQAIAEKLYQLSQHHQVLCVTHQPIVAAMADQHLRVSKHLIDSTKGSTNGHTIHGYEVIESESTNGSKSRSKRKKKQPDSHSPISDLRSPIPDPSNDIRTVVRVTPLTADQRKQELAQLAGGQSPEVLAFAESLLNQAAHLRQTQLSKSNLLSKAPAQPVKAVRSKSARKS